MSGMTSQALENLAKMAFALAIREAYPNLSPKAEDVRFKEGLLQHSCEWEDGATVIQGYFYHWLYHRGDSGAVCIATMFEGWHYRYPHSWHHLWYVQDAYADAVEGAMA